VSRTAKGLDFATSDDIRQGQLVRERDALPFYPAFDVSSWTTTTKNKEKKKVLES